MRKLLLFYTILFLSIDADAQTVGLFQNTPASFNGYTLFSNIFGKTAYLIDNCGKSVHSWSGGFPNSRTSAYLLPDGSLIRSGNDGTNLAFGASAGGSFEKLDWNSSVIWKYKISDSSQCAHHDFTVMPNGNLLVVVWETLPASELIAHGRNPANIGASFWADKIVELTPIGSDSAIIVWEWHASDHFIQDYSASALGYGSIADHPELIDINLIPTGVGSWMHVNSIDYNPDLDQILFSVRNFNEFMVIDHSTTTAEAATHTGGGIGRGGDILYRWGNPENYKLGTPADRKLFQQHDAKWITAGMPRAGEIMVFNNGMGRPAGAFSTVEIVRPPLLSDSSYAFFAHQAFAPASNSWMYPSQPDTAFYSSTMGGAKMLPNGNVLICEASSGELFEVDSVGSTVWKYISPLNPTGILTQGQSGNNAVFKVTRYAPNYSGFNAQTLISGLPIENNPLPYVCSLYVINNTPVDMKTDNSISIFPNPSTGSVTLSITADRTAKWSIRLFDLSGRILNEYSHDTKEGKNAFNLDFSGFAKGCYLLEASSSEKRLKEMILLK